MQFLVDDAGVRLELIRPLSPDSPAARALKSGGGLNHICYQVADLEASMRALVASFVCTTEIEEVCKALHAATIEGP